MGIRRFEDLEAWKLARELTRNIYAVTASGTFARDFELLRQVRSAAGSAMHNCAEGFDGGSNTEFARFLKMAQRSCTEVQSQLYVALDQQYITADTFDQLYDQANQVHRCIGGLIRYLRANPTPKGN